MPPKSKKSSAGPKVTKPAEQPAPEAIASPEPAKAPAEPVLAPSVPGFIRYCRAVRVTGGFRALETLEISPELLRAALQNGHARLLTDGRGGDLMDGLEAHASKAARLDEEREGWTMQWALQARLEAQ